MSSCIFCSIVEKKIPAKIAFEDDHILAFHDIHPQAPTHVLVIPKLHIETLLDIKQENAALMGHLMTHLPAIARNLGLDQGFRTIINTGPVGGQEVYHFHAHILGSTTPLPRMMPPLH